MRPPPLNARGLTLAVVAPASPPTSSSTLPEGIARLQAAGVQVKTLQPLHTRTSYLCGSDQERAAVINAAFLDDEVDALLCVRGGYGSLRILPLIDYDTVRRRPKLVIGYSDITALHLALFARAGLTGISGPMAAVDWAGLSPERENQFWNLAGGHLCTFDHPLECLREGLAEGLLFGGNLAVLTRLIGTPYLPPLDGAILFLEDVNEPPYRVDAMLAHLKLAGLWDRLGGLVLGQFTGEDAPNRTPPDVAAVFEEYCLHAPFPVATNLPYGHIPEKWAIPQGVRARLTAEKTRTSLTMLEPIVRHRPSA